MNNFIKVAVVGLGFVLSSQVVWANDDEAFVQTGVFSTPRLAEERAAQVTMYGVPSRAFSNNSGTRYRVLSIYKMNSSQAALASRRLQKYNIDSIVVIVPKEKKKENTANVVGTRVVIQPQK